MRVVTFLVAIAVASLSADQGAAAQSGPDGARPTANAATGNAANGKKLFAAYGCYECHGYEGQGGAGARLAPRPRLALPAFAAYVRRPTQEMPPYTGKVVTEQELADIYAFLLTVPQPRAASSIPELSD